ncbi:MAG: signal peptidase II [Anaerolineae bacterium]|nr:signal peptidase II [Anaerolineae bacterium]
MKQRRPDVLVLLIVAALVVLADQITKRMVTAWLGEGESRELLPWLTPIFRITHVTNTGAAFGLLPEWGDLFVGVAIVVIATIFVYYWHMTDGQWLMRIALGFQLGGATGNLIDRLRQGAVTDFIDLNFWPMHHWPVFNLADSAIVAGVVLLVLLMLWEEQRSRAGRQVVGDGGDS